MLKTIFTSYGLTPSEIKAGELEHAAYTFVDPKTEVVDVLDADQIIDLWCNLGRHAGAQTIEVYGIFPPILRHALQAWALSAFSTPAKEQIELRLYEMHTVPVTVDDALEHRFDRWVLTHTYTI